jgi:uncharacterized membrane protein YdjX (TVP38/TMEM64 family)
MLSARASTTVCSAAVQFVTVAGYAWAMTSNTPEHEPNRTSAAPAGRIERIERAIKDDVAEAKAIAPLVDSAGTVQANVRSKLKRALPLLALAALGVTLLVSGVYEKLSLENLGRYHRELEVWVAHHPWLAALTIAGVLAVVISTGLPGGAVVVVAAGLFFGTVKGALISVVGDVAGATVLYVAARRLFDGGAGKPPALVEKIRAGFQDNPISFAFFIRLVPVFPYGACSVALAWLGCRFRLFFVASSLGVIPSTTVFAGLGAGLATTIARQEKISLSVLSEPRFAVPLIGLAVLALLPVLLGLRKRKPVT